LRQDGQLQRSVSYFNAVGLLLLFSREERSPNYEKGLTASSCVCLPICPSVRVEELGSHWTDFHEILYVSVLQNICPENSSFIKISQE
jgi:hypothetical protein